MEAQVLPQSYEPPAEGQQDGTGVPTAPPLPVLRPDLLIRPLGEEGQYVVKDPATGAYFRIGEQEHFLLAQMDGRRTAAEACAAFRERFGEPLSEEELEEFLGM